MPHVLPQGVAKSLQSAGAHNQRGMFYVLFVLFFLLWLFHFIIVGQVFCPRAVCTLRPPRCWPLLETPEADPHMRYHYGYDSAGWAPVARMERGPLPNALFSWTHLEKRVSTQLATCTWPLAQINRMGDRDS